MQTRAWYRVDSNPNQNSKPSTSTLLCIFPKSADTIARSAKRKTVVRSVRRRKVRRAIVSKSQEEYLDQHYTLTQPVHFCGGVADMVDSEEDSEPDNGPTADLGVISGVGHVDLSTSSRFRSALSVLPEYPNTDRQRGDRARVVGATSRPESRIAAAGIAPEPNQRRRNRRSRGRSSDLPSRRFGAMLTKAATEHQDLQCRPSMTHRIGHTTKSSLLVCAPPPLFALFRNTCRSFIFCY